MKLQDLKINNMTPEQFVYWLQGFLETANPKEIGEKETQIIKDHLQTVFKKETPFYPTPGFTLDHTPNWNLPTIFC